MLLHLQYTPLIQVFTPVMERARRVSRTISRPFAEDWSSDEDEDEEETDPLTLFAVSIMVY